MLHGDRAKQCLESGPLSIDLCMAFICAEDYHNPLKILCQLDTNSSPSNTVSPKDGIKHNELRAF